MLEHAGFLIELSSIVSLNRERNSTTMCMTSLRQNDKKRTFQKRHILCPDYIILETVRDPLNNVK